MTADELAGKTIHGHSHHQRTSEGGRDGRFKTQGEHEKRDGEQVLRQTDRNGDRKRETDKCRGGETEMMMATGTFPGGTYCVSSGQRGTPASKQTNKEHKSRQRSLKDSNIEN